MSRTISTFVFLSLAVWMTGCGSSQTIGAPSTPTPGSRTVGDIPDTATYLVYQGQKFSLKYVEGWSIQQGSNSSVTISDKDSFETVSIPNTRHKDVKTYAAVDLSALQSRAPRFHLITHHGMQLPSGQAQYIQYSSLSAPDPVTNKRVPVTVDRYYISSQSRLAILTLSTPRGVDNVDAYRLISRSFRWK